MEVKKLVTVKMSIEQYDYLRQLANTHFTTMSTVIRQLLAAHQEERAKITYTDEMPDQS